MSEDFERYGDYNEIDEAPKSKNPVLIALKVITAVEPKGSTAVVYGATDMGNNLVLKVHYRFGSRNC